jgi:hypothetical protein
VRADRQLPSRARAKDDAEDVAYAEVKDLRPLRDKRLESFEADEIEARVQAAIERGNLKRNHKRVYRMNKNQGREN